MWFKTGRDLSEFWSITPHIYGICLEAYEEKTISDYNQSVFFMWHNANLSGARKMPSMKNFLIDDKSQKTDGGHIDESAIIARLKAYSKRYKKECPL